MYIPKISCTLFGIISACLIAFCATSVFCQQAGTYSANAASDSVKLAGHVNALALPDLVAELRPLADSVLHGQLYEHRLKAAKSFQQAFRLTLERNDSYDFGFDSLATISRLYPKDQSFRIFTWVIVDTLGEHHYYGLVQRRYTDKGRQMIAVIPLKDRVKLDENLDRAQLGPASWLGALYYKPRETPFGVLSYATTGIRVNGYTGKEVREKQTLYVVLGLNENNRTSNYKIIEVISFDAKDPRKVVFGAPIIYFSAIPKSRAVFKYSDNSIFSLNLGKVKTDHGTEEMIVFDHLGQPNKVENFGSFNYGADGSTDALRYYSKNIYEGRSGFLGYVPDVYVDDPAQSKLDSELIKKRQADELARLKAAGFIIPGTSDQGKGAAPKPKGN